MTHDIHPVILCGGSGTRLWPLSRQSYPKQFVPLLGDETLFQASARRVSEADFAPPVIVTGSDFRFVATQQLMSAGIDPGAVLIEPEGRDTGPAVLAATLGIAADDPEAIVLITPSDHRIADPDAFRGLVRAALPTARSGRIVTFGIRPTRAETGYGWLEADTPADGEPVPLRRFVEKPDAARAAEMLAEGHFLWNAGIFLARADVLIAAFEAHAADLVAPVRAAVSAAQPDLGFLRLDPGPWAELRKVSLDYAVMESADNLSVMPFAGAWSDLGGWEAVWSESDRDSDDVASEGPVMAIDCHRSLLRAESPRQSLVAIGLDDMIAVAMPDAVLVAPRGRAQDVKAAVERLKADGAAQATTLPIDHRPWGWFESLIVGNRFQVKRIHVRPGAALSLQSHHHRSEHWIVVEGTAKVTVDDEVKLVTENQSVYIPLGAVHRMENPGKVPMVLIEVQTGSYLGEDDIVRLEDVYARG
ncbi:mannose-1-phosphate guanylyltransferase/mannose-6-phosphate isomerase [Wenxinia marina]|uniref:mannose-1-phosphate guanylyltransferase n=1 Tax=Wenxinia marina DSM 24838 TaxID=1123501 RepID=A0A0D0QGL4_9RHOB|nr:mannose-1-phosphate guanylyltransferase/mannose-6-phosphate isomerase [Wenxinia marina]KIQ71407.1 Mannose-1-phosphate guanylyltransferase [Wenxinia marina DSM 24838]GGL78731.1 mannose-1-phosphate guanylyltransferase/mannose-6-phosphate isomerase [Wenxinia marina]